MSEDRTQGPSKQRRQQAWERGLVAHSPELTGAVGLLAASALLAIWGDDLTAALLGLVREPLVGARGSRPTRPRSWRGSGTWRWPWPGPWGG